MGRSAAGRAKDRAYARARRARLRAAGTCVKCARVSALAERAYCAECDAYMLRYLRDYNGTHSPAPPFRRCGWCGGVFPRPRKVGRPPPYLHLRRLPRRAPVPARGGVPVDRRARVLRVGASLDAGGGGRESRGSGGVRALRGATGVRGGGVAVAGPAGDGAEAEGDGRAVPALSVPWGALARVPVRTGGIVGGSAYGGRDSNPHGVPTTCS